MHGRIYTTVGILCNGTEKTALNTDIETICKYYPWHCLYMTMSYCPTKN